MCGGGQQLLQRQSDRLLASKAQRLDSTNGATSQCGPSSEKGKPQKRKLPASNSKDGEEGVVKSKRRRKNEVPSEEGDSQDRYVKLYILCSYGITVMLVNHIKIDGARDCGLG